MSKLLFVCTGNTCRSPLAMCAAAHLGHEAKSAGISAVAGMPASGGAINAAARLGLSLAGHTSRELSQADVRWADRVICLADNHYAALIKRYPQMREKITVFEPSVPDPFGASDEVYEQIAGLIFRLVNSMDFSG